MEQPTLLLDPVAIRDWFRAFRHKLSGRGLWLLGGEPGTADPAEWPEARLRVLIVRLSSYADTAAGISHSFLLQLARSVPGVYADLAFLPPTRDEALMREAGIPFLVGTGSKQPASAFDVIAISNSVVQELVNLPALLAGSGIPLSRQGRERAESPFVLLGGSNSYAVDILHGPIGEVGPTDDADGEGLVDGVIVGDGEGAFPRFLETCIAAQSCDRSKRRVLFRREVPGFLDPAAYREDYSEDGRLIGIEAVEEAPFPVKAWRARNTDLRTTFVEGPIWFDGDTAGASQLLVSAGCPYFCSFCKESWEQKPYRERDPETLINAALQLKANLGLSEVSLMTFNLNTFSGLGPLLDALEPRFHRVSLKSQRFDAIARSPRLLDRQLAAGKRTYTCAMEGISERVRAFLQKNLDEPTLLSGFRELFDRNIRQMKVFLIVTGEETEADLTEFAAFLGKLRAMMAGLKGKPTLTFSRAALFRPPLTPLQFCPSRRTLRELELLGQKIVEVVARAGFESRISAESWDAGLSEYLAWADRRSTPILVAASLAGRHRYRGEVEPALYHFWNRELEKRGLTEAFHGVVRDEATVFPWDLIDTGIPVSHLWKNYRELVAGRELPSCLASPLGTGRCQACGACQDAAERARVTAVGAAQPTAARPPVDPERPRKYRVEAEVPADWGPASNEVLFAILGRMLMRASVELVPHFLHFVEGLDRSGSGGYFLADFTVRPEAPDLLGLDLALCNSFGNGMKILAIQSPREPLAEAIPPLTMEISLPGETGCDRKIDTLLAKYRLRHLKKWVGESLTWELQSGQAKKEGFTAVRWAKGSCRLEVDLLHAMQPHLIGQLASGGERLLKKRVSALPPKPAGGPLMGRRKAE